MKNEKTKTKKRSKPRKKVQRRMLELTTTPDQVDMMLRQFLLEEQRVARARKEFDQLINDMIIKGILEPGNEMLDPADQQESMTLYASDGSIRFSIGRQIKRFFDDRAHQAKVFIEDFINEHEQKTMDTDPDVKVLINMLKTLFFGTRQKRHFKFTPELQDFMNMEGKDLHDERIIKAQQILKSAMHIEKSKWYYYCEVWNKEELDYDRVS